MSGIKRNSPYKPGQQFWAWTVVEDRPRIRRKFACLCRCECGQERVLVMSTVANGGSKSCGCRMTRNGEKLVKDMVGLRFGRLLVVERAGSTGRKATWACRCDCGAEHVATGYDLRAGHTTSCGCKNRPHGLSGHRLYQTWSSMMKRCYNSACAAFKDYGGRGITVCSEWHDPRRFIEDMWPSFVEGMSLDRVDNSAGYSKENCKWATRSQQNSNKRPSVYVITPLGRFSWADAAFMYGKAVIRRFPRERAR